MNPVGDVRPIFFSLEEKIASHLKEDKYQKIRNNLHQMTGSGSSSLSMILKEMAVVDLALLKQAFAQDHLVVRAIHGAMLEKDIDAAYRQWNMTRCAVALKQVAMNALALGLFEKAKDISLLIFHPDISRETQEIVGKNWRDYQKQRQRAISAYTSI